MLLSIFRYLPMHTVKRYLPFFKDYMNSLKIEKVECVNIHGMNFTTQIIYFKGHIIVSKN